MLAGWMCGFLGRLRAWGGRHRVLRAVVALIAMLCVASVAVNVFWSARLRAEVARIRADGAPVTWEEALIASPALPDDQNSALVLERAVELLNTKGWVLHSPELLGMCEERELGVRPSAELVGLLQSYTERNAPMLAGIHEAARLPSGAWSVAASPVWRGGCACCAGREWPHLEALQGLAQAARAEGWLRAGERDGVGVRKAIVAVRRIAASLGDCRDVEELRMRGDVATQAISLAEWALSLGELSSADLNILRAEFRAELTGLSAVHALRNERAAGILTATEGCGESEREWLGVSPWEPGWLLLRCLENIPGKPQRDALWYAGSMRRWIEIAALPPRRQLAEMRMFRAEERADMESRITVFPPLVSYLSPVSWAELRSALLVRQRMAVADAALAVEQFRLAHKRWPDSLDQLVPQYLADVPQDWFAPEGAPIQYRRAADGVRVWSIAVSDLDYEKLVSTDTGGLTGDEASAIKEVAWAIVHFHRAEGVLPAKLTELVPRFIASVPEDVRTGEPLSYETRPGDDARYILAGYLAGMSEADFWKHTLALDQYASSFSNMYDTVFRLLVPELRGMRQTTFKEELRDGISWSNGEAFLPLGLMTEGFTRKELVELGFIESNLDYAEEERQSP
jgi:hypothetical protein